MSNAKGTTYNVQFSCNPDLFWMPAAQSNRKVTVDKWEDIPAAALKARGEPADKHITIISVSLVRE